MTDRFMDGYDDPWGPAGRYGGKLVNWMVQSRAGVSADDLGEAVPEEKFNNEGEKQMEKIDWNKPLRAFKTPGHEVVGAKVYTYKSGRQRVIWVDERVYPVDDQGRAVADVDYGPNRVHKGAQFVENVPEEKFFVGLYRHIGTSNYFLEDGGVMKTRERVKLAECPDQWIVDTRKSAEPPKAIEHDPKDWIAVYWGDDGEVDTQGRLMTKREAENCALADTVVRVRTTPAPVDTSRYIQLYRMKESEPWRINALGSGRQEFTWAETRHRSVVDPCRTAIKVRD